MLTVSRKVLLRVSCLIVGLSVLIFLTTCAGAGGGGGAKSPSDVTDVGTISPSAMANSGVSDANVPTDLTGMKTAFNAVPSSDALLTDLQNAFSAIGSAVTGKGLKTPLAASALSRAVLAFGAAVHRDLGAEVKTQIDKIATDIQNFPTTKSLNETIDLSGNDLGTYIYLTKATGAFSASVVTTDGGALNTDTMANYKSGSGQATVSLVVDPKNLASASSAVKDFRLRLNAGATVSLGATKNSSGDVVLANLSFDYGESGVLAISLNNGTAGGKVILTANSKNKGTIVDPEALFNGGDFSSLAPQITVTLSIYTDSGALNFSKTWTDVQSLVNDLGSG
jgi:hypothetical protein